MLKTKMFLLCALLSSTAVYAEALSLYCESGDPGGAGPLLYIDFKEEGPSNTIEIELNINSTDPESRRPNTTIAKNFMIPKSAQNDYQFILSKSYLIQLTKNAEDDLWTARIDSRRNKFESIYLPCQ